MRSIEREIGIQCQDGVPFIDFSHSHNAHVGQRHRGVPIFAKQLAQRGGMLVDPDRNAERTILRELAASGARVPHNSLFAIGAEG